MNPGTFLRALALAAEKHRDQRRKGAEASPYINHPIAVATVLAAEAEVTDGATLLAAILHDTIEDTQTTLAELEEQFGGEVSRLVAEVTDDKRLPQPVRKALQVPHAASLSPKAKLLKLADKICNLRDLVRHPPVGWSALRRREYVEWTAHVAAGCRGINPRLDSLYDRALVEARECLCAQAE